MNKREFIEGIMDKNRISKHDALKLTEIVFERIQECLLEGREVRIDGVGAFRVRFKKPGIVRNNIVGEDQQVGPRVKLRFRTYRSMQRKLNQGLAKELNDVYGD